MTEATTGSAAIALRPRQTIGDRALAWWQRYCDPNDRINRDPSVRARLRRCRAPVDVLAITPAVALARQVGAMSATSKGDDQRLLAALSLGRVLAHIDRHTNMRPMQVAGWKRFPNDRRESDAGEDRPELSEARFRRLIETGDGEEQVAAFVRLIRLLNGEMNVSAIATDFLDWTHPVRGDRVRRRWAFDYYAAGIAAPADPPVSEDDE
jgi:CRISPR system Cascade subunit CasB